MGVMPARSNFSPLKVRSSGSGVEGAASYGAGISALLRPGCRRGGAADPVGSAAGREVGPARRVPPTRPVLAERSTPVKDPAIGGLRS
jgi:hypothetical protein